MCIFCINKPPVLPSQTPFDMDENVQQPNANETNEGNITQSTAHPKLKSRSESHKGVNIGNAIDFCMEEWGLSKVMCITVDNAFSNDSAVSQLKKRLLKKNAFVLGGDAFHMRCCAHIIQLVMRDGLDAVQEEDEEIDDYFIQMDEQKLASESELDGYLEELLEKFTLDFDLLLWCKFGIKMGLASNPTLAELVSPRSGLAAFEDYRAKTRCEREQELQTSVSKVTQHYKDYYTIKWDLAHEDCACFLLSNLDFPFREYVSLGYWVESSAVLKLVNSIRTNGVPSSSLVELTQEQMRKVEALRVKIRLEEEKVERETKRHQVAIADMKMAESVRLVVRVKNEEEVRQVEGLVQVALKGVMAG
ncbi:hypothetical protein GH714_012730 [Hevea brasiliensis]|uniref:DOG1 domain-containing protein n=1 Tax=Hevea brasiliensis TaxID=3981 RepID=A0A6A6LR86_HEVBR|nr:hypothetical protein GH714_012730 [Hevea brasiliensis]